MADEFPDTEESPLATVTAGAVTALTFLVGFGLMFLGVPYFWVAFPVGFAGVLPMALGLVKYYERRQESGSQEDQSDPLETLRDRYARGELSEAEFERRVEDLLETESGPENAVDTVPGRERTGDESGREPETE